MSSSDVEMPSSGNLDSEPGTPGQVCVARRRCGLQTRPRKGWLQRQAVCVESPQGQPARLYKAFRHLAARGRI
jgi:hypothetical protein